MLLDWENIEREVKLKYGEVGILMVFLISILMSLQIGFSILGLMQEGFKVIYFLTLSISIVTNISCYMIFLNKDKIIFNIINKIKEFNCKI